MDAQQRVYKRFERLKKPDRVKSWTLAPSTRAGKKWVVTIIPRDTRLGDASRPILVHFGDSSMQDYTQLLEHAPADAKERRLRFHQRFATLIAQTHNNPLSPMFYSAKLLW